MKALALTVWYKKIFKVFFFSRLPSQPEFSTELKSLKYFESASPKDHFCEASLKSVDHFQRKISFKYFFRDGKTDGRTPDIDR